MLYIPFPFKRCSKCREYFLPTPKHFPVRKSRGNRLESWCRICHRKRTHAWAKEHPEAGRKRARQWEIDNPERKRDANRAYSEQNRGKERRRGKLYRETHTEKARKSKNIWRKNNPEKQKNATLRWQKSHPEKGREAAQRRLARKNGLSATLTAQEWRHALDYWHGCCAYCGNPPSFFDRSAALHQEHFIPMIKGGAYTSGNILPACQSCNFGKADQDPLAWITKRFGPRKGEQILKRIREYFAAVSHDVNQP